MGEVVGVFCASHSPGLTGFPSRADNGQRAKIMAAFAEVGSAIADLAPEAIVGVSVEHFTNFFLSNLPAFAIGTASRYRGPATAQMATFLNLAERDYPGQSDLGAHIYRYALGHAFDPSLVAGGFAFDENFCVPLELTSVRDSIPLVPVVVNAVIEPYPTLARCYDFGRLLQSAIAAYESPLRVVVFATGGLSHYVGMPQAGEINVDFDREFLRRLSDGSRDPVVDYSDAEIDQAGNGAHEIRTWVVAAGVAASPFRTLVYEPIPAWLTGTAVAAAVPSHAI
jgi:aromatic ring-opening dioxygenase catalytic subunit (LigB family)